MHAVIVCGLGEFGAATARRIEREHADVARFVFAEGASLDPVDVAARVLETARLELAHERMCKVRDKPGEDLPTTLIVPLVASAAETAVRSTLAATIENIEDRLLGALGPIFRKGSARNAVVLPLIAMPHPAGRADGPEVVSAIRDLIAWVRARPPERRCTPQIFVIEDVIEFSILSERELAQNVRNFVTLLVRSRWDLPDLADRATVLYGGDLREPLATFACAVAEFPRAAVTRWATAKVALEVVDAVLEAKIEPAPLAQIDALEEIEFRKLMKLIETLGDPVHVVKGLLREYPVDVGPDEPPRFWERGDVTRARYGPDHGDPSLGDAQPAPEAPSGFARERMESIERVWRLLQRKRFDDLVARECADVARERDALLERVRARVDRELWDSPAPSPEAFRRTAELVDKLRREVGIQLEEAIAKRDQIRPADAPSFESFRSVHAHLLDAARRKPDPPVLLLWTLLAVLGAIAVGPTLLWAWADAIGAGPADWYEPLLRAHGAITAALASALLIGGALGARLAARHRELVEAHAAMWEALKATVYGEPGTPGASLLQYFESRLRLSRCAAQVEALLAVRAALDRDAELLQLTDRAARRARAEIREEMRALGALGENGSVRLAGLLAGRGEALVEALVNPGVAARSLQRQLPPEEREQRVADTLKTLAQGNGEAGWAARWREEVPFSSVDALLKAARRHASRVAEWDPVASSEDAEATADAVARFIRRQARSLRAALDVAGRAREESEVRPISQGIAIVPRPLLEAVRRHLADEGAAGRTPRCEAGAEADRAYYLVVVPDISLDHVDSFRAASPPPRFEVEEESPGPGPGRDAGERDR